MLLVNFVLLNRNCYFMKYSCFPKCNHTGNFLIIFKILSLFSLTSDCDKSVHHKSRGDDKLHEMRD